MKTIRSMKITKALMKKVLYQANQKFNTGPGDIYTVDALREVGLADYAKILAELRKRKYITESGEPDYYRVTHRGEMFGTGQKCPCRECDPKAYR